MAERTGYDIEEVTYLLGHQGLSEEEILLVAQNDDLWIESPELRWFSLDAEEEIREWRKTEWILNNLVDATIGGELFESIGVHTCLADASERAKEARRSARRRALEAS